MPRQPGAASAARPGDAGRKTARTRSRARPALPARLRPLMVKSLVERIGTPRQDAASRTAMLHDLLRVPYGLGANSALPFPSASLMVRQAHHEGVRFPPEKGRSLITGVAAIALWTVRIMASAKAGVRNRVIALLILD